MFLGKFYIALIFSVFFVFTAIAEEPGSTTVKARPAPCQADPLFNAFDFWLGEWEVFSPEGKLAGVNSIQKTLRGCLVTESWRGEQGSRGTSVNYLDKATNEWVQVWNDAGGGQIHIRGGMTDDGMLLVGKIHYVRTGQTADFRGLWTPLPDGRVRQFFEQSVDGGETWAPWFEGFYRRADTD